MRYTDTDIRLKELEIQNLEQQITAVNNQINNLEHKSVSLSSSIILAKRQLDIMKGFKDGS